MLYCLVQEGVIQKRKIKVGGLISKMVKSKMEELSTILKAEGDEHNDRSNETSIFLRENKHKEMGEEKKQEFIDKVEGEETEYEGIYMTTN